MQVRHLRCQPVCCPDQRRNFAATTAIRLYRFSMFQAMCVHLWQIRAETIRHGLDRDFGHCADNFFPMAEIGRRARYFPLAMRWFHKLIWS